MAVIKSVVIYICLSCESRNTTETKDIFDVMLTDRKTLFYVFPDHCWEILINISSTSATDLELHNVAHFLYWRFSILQIYLLFLHQILGGLSGRSIIFMQFLDLFPDLPISLITIGKYYDDLFKNKYNKL